MWLSIFLLFPILIGNTWSSPHKNDRYKIVNSERQSWDYLEKYGYNPCSNSSKKFACNVDHSSMLRDYQKRFGLTTTGILDRSTKEEMNRPRCGIKDTQFASLGSYKWSRSSLTWSLHNYPRQISKNRVKAIIEKAFNAWLTHIPLKVNEVCETCSADMKIDVTRDWHNCQGSFDGPGGTLAHAFFPEDGRIHFDADEPWTERSGYSDINFYTVAVHEIGHALGLDHNYNRDSIMFPSYIPDLDVTTLPEYDRHSIQAIYNASHRSRSKSRVSDGNRPREPDSRGGGNIIWKDNWAYGCDFKGNDLSQVDVSADQCGPECDAKEGCTHFTWTNEKDGICQLKSGRISKADAIAKGGENRICGVASGDEDYDGVITWRRGNWANGCDFKGNDLSRVYVPADECGPECVRHRRCTHFSWTKEKGGICQLKSGRISKKDAIAKRDQSRVCGVKN